MQDVARKHKDRHEGQLKALSEDDGLETNLVSNRNDLVVDTASVRGGGGQNAPIIDLSQKQKGRFSIGLT
jgi:hypothetical protein